MQLLETKTKVVNKLFFEILQSIRIPSVSFFYSEEHNKKKSDTDMNLSGDCD